jgi:formylglycine-generating enzyme required for sulfatase activity
MSRIFLSHATVNSAEAVAIRDWLMQHGWEDVFLDVDPKRGIAAGEKWEQRLVEAASRCEVVLFLLSRAWIASGSCRKELSSALRLNKRLFGILIEDLEIADVPEDLTSEWQLVRLATGRDGVPFRVVLPITHEECHVTFSAEGLQRLKHGLEQAGLDAKYFAWPPANDANRSPYRGLKALEADDAGIFFGRDAAVLGALDELRGLRETARPRLFVILGSSGAGKSSFLRAGLLPRLKRDDRNFLPLPVIRPERATVFGETGFLAALEGACRAVDMTMTSAELRSAIAGGTMGLRPILQEFVVKATPPISDDGARSKAPMLLVSIDQSEELFLADGRDEARSFLAVLRDLLIDDAPAITALFTIRSDNYERLQLAEELDGLRQVTISLPPMPKGAYAEVIKGPARRLDGTTRELKIDDALVNELLVDMEAGGAKDALPLLAFTLERLYSEYHAGGHLQLEHYNLLGRVKGSIEAAVERAFKAADTDPAIPRDHAARLALLRRGLIPWLAGIDLDTGAPRRRIARLSEIPAHAQPLIEHLVDQHLLSTDVVKGTQEKTIEPAHEALLRQWSLLEGWLKEDSGLLSVIDGVQRASRDWTENGESSAWLTHTTGRLEAADRLSERPDLAALLQPADWKYLAMCREAERAAWEKERAAARKRKRMQAVVGLLMVGIIAGLIGWINQAFLKAEVNWFITMRPYMIANVRPYVLTAEAERALKPLASFRECAKDCPEMVVVPAGSFMMGSPDTESGRDPREGPQQKVTIAQPFAVSKFLVTFADWDTCVSVGGCPQNSEGSFGRGNKPAINVTWDEAKQYVAWFSQMTGQPYRLLSEAEWEYAARAGTTTAYPWGDEIGKGNANCKGCGSQWDGMETSPVGSFKPNAFGLFDMQGNVFQWVEDCYQESHNGAPTDGSARTLGNCKRRVVRGGSWYDSPDYLRSANRSRVDASDSRDDDLGFRVARTLGR